ncbi:MAG: NAD+ synthase [Gemmatimonadaceae bacterium]
MHQSVHLAIVQFKPRKGDYAGNLAHLGEIFAQLDALNPRPQVAFLPETAMSGYFLEGGVRDHAVTAGTLVRDLDEQYRAAVPSLAPLDVGLGFYEVWNNSIYNSALYVTLGGDAPVVRHIHRKVFLPTYGLFDEERFVDRGFEIRAFDTSWGRAAMLVCEDAWHSLSGTIAALDGAQVIFIASASPARGVVPRTDDRPGPGTLERWERLARDIASEHGVFVAVVQLVGTEGGKTFAGGSMVTGPRGDVKLRAPLWEEAIITATLDTGDLTRARVELPLLTDLQTMLPHMVRTIGKIQRSEPVPMDYDPASVNGSEPVMEGPESPTAKRELQAETSGSTNGETDEASPRSATISSPVKGRIGAVEVIAAPPGIVGPPPLDIDPALTADWLTTFLREEFQQRGFEKGIIGISGGVDSAVTAFLAARAIGAANVIGVRLPYRTSSKDSLEHAQLVIDALGIEGRTVDISAAVDAYLSNEPDADPARRGNVMARMRMIALFDLAAKYRGLPIGTGNKTERLLGYFTWHADDSPPINPLGDLFKTQVWTLAKHLGVPDVIVSKPASADLIEGQTDEGDFGISYAHADEILNWLVHGYGPGEIGEHGFSHEEVELVRGRLAGTHWKRKLPTVAMVSHSAIGESYLRPVDF